MPTLPKSYTRTWPPSSPERRAAVLVLLTLFLCAAAALSLRCGSQDYTLARLAEALWGGGSGTVRRILLHVRIPRTLAAALAGGALALSGASRVMVLLPAVRMLLTARPARMRVVRDRPARTASR